MTGSNTRRVKVSCGRCGKRLGFVVGPADLTTERPDLGDEWQALPWEDLAPKLKHPLEDAWWFDHGLEVVNIRGWDLVRNNREWEWRAYFTCNKCGAKPVYHLASLGVMWASGEPIVV